MSENTQYRLNQLISRFHDRLAKFGCTTAGEWRGELVENELLPMFKLERWASGPDQLTESSHRRLRRALQLASLFLTEDSTLGWFCHYTFGSRKKDSLSRTYISRTEYSKSKEARMKVRNNIRELAKVLTLMFMPSFGKTDEMSYGATYGSKLDLPFLKRFRSSDWPEVPSRRSTGHPYHPVIVLDNDFSKYFSQSLRGTDPDVWMRTQFLFAVTLVHEVAHAYSMWLGIDRDEPLWSGYDNKAELGFSWEHETLGYICNPSFHTITGCDMLFSMKAIPYQHDSQQPTIVQSLIGQHPFHFASMNPMFFEDIFQSQDYRGVSFYAGYHFDSGRKWVIAMYALPLEWIAQWFSEPHWEKRRDEWLRTHEYVPPNVGGTFVLVYQKNGGTVSVHFPLHPFIKQDKAQIPRAVEGERRRGGYKLPPPH